MIYSSKPNNEHVVLISEFIQQTTGLDLSQVSANEMEIHQKVDGKKLRLTADLIEETISRLDSDGRAFLQVNFLDGKKILLTEKLVGFKPAPCAGLDMKKLPRVVTTPDLISVIEAIEESLNAQQANEEIDVLRRVFDSVIEGGEAIGFNLSAERDWYRRLVASNHKASA